MLNYCAIVPAHNEAERIARTLNALRSRSELNTIIVVDDGSTDNTAQIADKNGADFVVRLEKNTGKGAALAKGVLKAPSDTDVFLFLDADLGDSATEFVKLITPIESGDADMAIGRLPPDPVLLAQGTKGGGLGFVVNLARAGIRSKTGLELSQPLSGQRALRRVVVEKIAHSFKRGFGVEVGLTLGVIRAGFRVVEVDTMFRHRVTGTNFKANLHRAKQLVDVFFALQSS